MRRRVSFYGIIIICLTFVEHSVAQTAVYPRVSSRHNFSFELSMNPAFFLECGYHRRIADIAGKPVLIHATVGSPMFLLQEFDSFRFGLGSSVKWIEHGRFDLVGGLFTSVATNENVNGKFVAWNLMLTVLPGYYHKKWFTALQFMWKPTIATRIAHSDYAKSAFDNRYPNDTPPDKMIKGPKDGWYLTPANRVMAGLMGGYTIGQSHTIYLKGGINYTPNYFNIFMFGDIGVIPYYANLGVIRHW
ncbi:hypothetical protein JNM05_03090 [bacterium]|nr:hypothetical protein [bacterium]